MYLIVFTEDVEGSEIVRGAKLVDMDQLVKLCSDPQAGCEFFTILKQSGNDFVDMDDDDMNEFLEKMDEATPQDIKDIFNAAMREAQEDDIILPPPDDTQFVNNRED